MIKRYKLHYDDLDISDDGNCVAFEDHERIVSELQSRLESLEKVAARYRQIPEVTQSMIEAAESVEDLYKRGTPETWAKVFRVMYADMFMHSAG